jgi:hypothetical protein
MAVDQSPLAEIAFAGMVIEWRGPAPFLFVAVPDELVGELRYAAREASYGWGVVPVLATINDAAFSTTLFPRDGGYLLPVKVAAQKSAKVGLGDRVKVRITVLGKAGSKPLSRSLCPWPRRPASAHRR